QRRREGKRACGAVRWGGSARRRRALARPLARPSDGAIAMDYGLYLSAAGVLTNMHRTDVHANNLANVATTGFKPDFAVIRQRLPERLEDNIADVPAHELLERLGGGVLVDPTRSDFTQGRLETSDQPLDLALQGDGFFVVDSGRGEDDERLRLSRDGRFTIDARGTLVRSTDGLPVL